MRLTRLMAPILLAALAGCGFRPDDRPLGGSDMKPGPGLLTGPTGEFVVQRGAPVTPPPARPR